jgi:hypothetical protein
VVVVAPKAAVVDAVVAALELAAADDARLDSATADRLALVCDDRVEPTPEGLAAAVTPALGAAANEPLTDVELELEVVPAAAPVVVVAATPKPLGPVSN